MKTDRRDGSDSCGCFPAPRPHARPRPAEQAAVAARCRFQWGLERTGALATANTLGPNRRSLRCLHGIDSPTRAYQPDRGGAPVRPAASSPTGCLPNRGHPALSTRQTGFHISWTRSYRTILRLESTARRSRPVAEALTTAYSARARACWRRGGPRLSPRSTPEPRAGRPSSRFSPWGRSARPGDRLGWRPALRAARACRPPKRREQHETAL